jgi:hypothetical protein
MKCADGETLNDRFGSSPTSSADSGAKNEKGVYNGQCDQWTNDQYEKRIEKRASITRGGDGDPEAIVCVIVDFVGVLVAIAGSVNGKIECIFFVFS